jgi:hypothetical protein
MFKPKPKCHGCCIMPKRISLFDVACSSRSVSDFVSRLEPVSCVSDWVVRVVGFDPRSGPAQPNPTQLGPARAPLAPLPTSPCAPPPLPLSFAFPVQQPLLLPPLSLPPRGALGFGEGDRRSWIPGSEFPPPLPLPLSLLPLPFFFPCAPSPASSCRPHPGSAGPPASRPRAAPIPTTPPPRARALRRAAPPRPRPARSHPPASRLALDPHRSRGRALPWARPPVSALSPRTRPRPGEPRAAPRPARSRPPAVAPAPPRRAAPPSGESLSAPCPRPPAHVRRWRLGPASGAGGSAPARRALVSPSPPRRKPSLPGRAPTAAPSSRALAAVPGPVSLSRRLASRVPHDSRAFGTRNVLSRVRP